MSLFGILNINKPAGITSRDAVNRVERLTRPVRCGHAGTLDPLASGVLVICVGNATRLVQYVQRMPKRYRATFLLGCQSPTDDIEGEITQLEAANQPTRMQIEAALPSFLGEVLQRPPDHSAVKVAGRRAYSLARKGKPVDLLPRPVTIHSLVIARFEHPELELEIECGSGTYVRALGRDLAQSLGTAAVMSALVRTAVGKFSIANAVREDDLTDVTTLTKCLQPAAAAVASLPKVTIAPSQLVEIRNGKPIPIAEVTNASSIEGEWAGVDTDGRLVAIVRQKRPGEWWPTMNLPQ